MYLVRCITDRQGRPPSPFVTGRPCADWQRGAVLRGDRLLPGRELPGAASNQSSKRLRPMAESPLVACEGARPLTVDDQTMRLPSTDVMRPNDFFLTTLREDLGLADGTFKVVIVPLSPFGKSSGAY